MSLKMIIKKTVPNMIVHCVEDDEIWASSNYTLYRSKDEGTTFNKVADLPVPFMISILGRVSLFARALRLGVRSMRKLKSGTVLVVANRKLFRLTGNKFKVVYCFKRGLGPMREGWCEDEKENCYMAEYFLNKRRNTSSELLKSTDDGQSWGTIYSLDSVRHIHCVQYDRFGRKIWLGTGDTDEESSISFSQDEGETWTKIGSGDQIFRAVSLLFTQDYVYWGSDAPTRQNYIYRYDRRGREIKRLVAVDGPVYYSTILKNEIKIISTTTEGNSKGGSAEWDRKAHIWASEDGVYWEDLMSWEKDAYPDIRGGKLLGYGRVILPHGQLNDTLFFTTQCLRKVGNMLSVANLSTR